MQNIFNYIDISYTVILTGIFLSGHLSAIVSKEKVWFRPFIVCLVNK